MELQELMMLTRSDVELRIQRTAEMKFYSNGEDITEAIRGMDLAYIAELDQLMARHC